MMDMIDGKLSCRYEFDDNRYRRSLVKIDMIHMVDMMDRWVERYDRYHR